MSDRQKFQTTRLREETRRKMDAFARRNRLPIAEAFDVAADLLARLTPEQEREVIQRQDEPQPTCAA